MIFFQLNKGTVNLVILLLKLLILLLFDLRQLIKLAVLLCLVTAGVVANNWKILDEFTLHYFVNIGHKNLLFRFSHPNYLLNISLVFLLLHIHGQVKN